ncbi:SDR family oxidoreductase [Acerihabitans sp. KWT182]|uniref:SDR family oxidoreductase n=1 Tax=Acerihabitans sp. KWT182 TaxID=3157919 RepID=A0AAU7Q4R5_9GAMM
MPWPLHGPRRAGVSSFGAGGTNVHMVLAEGPAAVAKRAAVGLHAIPLSGSDPARLKALAADMAQHLGEQPATRLADIYVTLSQGRRVESCKTVLYAHDRRELMAQLEAGDFHIATDAAAPRLILIVGGHLPCAAVADHPVFNRELTSLLAWLDVRYPAQVTRQDVLDKSDAQAGRRNLAQAVGTLACLLMWRSVIATPFLILTPEENDMGEDESISPADIVRAVACSPSESMVQTTKGEWCSVVREYLAQSAFGAGGGMQTEAGRYSARLINPGEPVFIPTAIPPNLAAHSGECEGNFLQVCRDRGVEIVFGPSAAGAAAMLRCAGALWRRGVDIHWRQLCHYPDAGRIPLPVQPLRRRRCWYQPQPDERDLTSPPGPVTGGLSVGDGQSRPQLYVERWRRSGRCAAETGDNDPCRRLVLAEPACRFASVLAEALKKRTGAITMADLGPATAAGSDGYRLDLHDAQAADRLAEALMKDNLMPDHLLVLFGDAEDSAHASVEVVFILLELAKAFSMRRRTPLLIDVIGPGFFDATGSGTLCPERAAAWAACQSLMQEIPHVTCRCVDVDTPEPSVAGDVLGELTAPRRPSLVALRNGWRWQRYFQTLEEDTVPKQWQNLICLVSGGLGRVGYQLARFMALRHHAKLIILTRTPLHALAENDKRRERLRRLKSLAPAVEVAHADIADLEQSAAALERAERRIGAINCFIHAAGISGPATVQWVQKSTRQQWLELMRPGFTGASVLHALLGRRPLRFGCFTSSLSAYAGGLGLSAYAAANEACASFALRHGRRHPYLCIDWAGWRGWDSGGSFRYSAARARPLSDRDVFAAFAIALDNLHQGRLSVALSPPDALGSGIFPAKAAMRTPPLESGPAVGERVEAYSRPVAVGADAEDCSRAAAVGANTEACSPAAAVGADAEDCSHAAADAAAGFRAAALASDAEASPRDSASVIEPLREIWRDVLRCEVDSGANFF